MDLDFSTDGEFGILRISGDINKLATSDFREYMDIVVDHACQFMIFDLSAVTRMSTSGLGMIFAAKNRLDDIGAHMAVVGHIESLSAFVTASSLEKMVPICQSVGRAKIALRRLAYERRARNRRREVKDKS